MSEAPERRLNWWAALIAVLMLFPIAWLSFDNLVSAIIMAGTAGVAGLVLFPRKAQQRSEEH